MYPLPSVSSSYGSTTRYTQKVRPRASPSRWNYRPLGDDWYIYISSMIVSSEIRSWVVHTASPGNAGSATVLPGFLLSLPSLQAWSFSLQTLPYIVSPVPDNICTLFTSAQHTVGSYRVGVLCPNLNGSPCPRELCLLAPAPFLLSNARLHNTPRNVVDSGYPSYYSIWHACQETASE